MAKKSKPLTSKRAKLAAKTPQALPAVPSLKNELVPEVKAARSPIVLSDALTRVGQQLMFGLMDGALYGEIYAPAFRSYADRRDDTALRQLIESIVSDIAMRDAYAQYRKIDDICQRYLYYAESLKTALGSEKSTFATDDERSEMLELEALTLYWREQVFYCLLNDAEAIYGLLLPEQSMPLPPHLYFSTPELMSATHRVLSCTVGCVSKPKLTGDCADFFAFLAGRSFPYLGYEASDVFGYVGVGDAGRVNTSKVDKQLPDQELEQVFAMLTPEYVARFADCLRNSLEKTLFLDLIAAQHPKLYNELTEAFDSDESMPSAVSQRLMQRVRFDKTYREAFEKLLTAQPLSKALHRSSRLDIAELNMVGKLYARLQFAVKHQLAVFSFQLND